MCRMTLSDNLLAVRKDLWEFPIHDNSGVVGRSQQAEEEEEKEIYSCSFIPLCVRVVILVTLRVAHWQFLGNGMD